MKKFLKSNIPALVLGIAIATFMFVIVITAEPASLNGNQLALRGTVLALVALCVVLTSHELKKFNQKSPRK